MEVLFFQMEILFFRRQIPLIMIKHKKIMPNKKIQKIQTHKIKTQNKTMNKLK